MGLGPQNDLQRRALAEGSDSAGGVSVPDIVLARFIDNMRAALVTVRLGAQTVPLTSDKNTIARTATDAVATWRAENAAVNISDPTFSGVVLTPRSLAVIVKASREVLEDSVNIDSALDRMFRGAMAVEIDRVALVGTGTPPQPEGIANNADVNVVDHLGADIMSYDVFIDALVKCWQANSQTVSGIVMSPFHLGEVSKLKESTTDAPLMKPPVLASIPFEQTTNMPNDQIVVGDFSRLILGIRTSLRIELLRELYAENYQYAFLAHLRMDVGLEQPKAFCLIDNVAIS
jgi:HK97 family phage major capsid protein